MEILRIENLSFSYPEAKNPALNGIDFSVNEGEFVVICGKSGCGKSTLLRLLKKEIAPYGNQEGRIFYSNKNLSDVDARVSAGEIGFIHQNPENQIVTDYVWHEMAFGLENLGLDTQTIRCRVAETATRFGIENWFHKKTAELSGGQKQLLNLACVTAMQPKILLLDEPTAQLDPVAASSFISALQRLNQEMGITVLLVEHCLEDVFPFADRVLLMDKGEIAFFDKPKGFSSYFKSNPQHPMKDALPSAMRIFSMLGEEGESPITVRDGRDYISRRFENKIRTLDIPPYSHSNEKAVEFKDVYFRYGRDLPDILKDISLSVYKGEHFCILGGNGAGKSTFLSVAAGLLKAYRGKVYINGKKLTDYKGNSLYINNLAFLPQNPQTVFVEKTVKEDLLETCRTMQYSSSESEFIIAETAERLGVETLLDSHSYDLSGGEQQKAALAKMLILKPKILLLDEPAKGIDAHSKKAFCEIINSLKSDGITVITVTHDIEFAAYSADRVALFFDGDAVSVDTPESFFSENSFYTTAASRISRVFFNNSILCEQVVRLCEMNKKAVAENE